MTGNKASRDRSLRRILRSLRADGPATRRELIERLKCSDDTVHRAVRKLRQNEHLYGPVRIVGWKLIDRRPAAVYGITDEPDEVYVRGSLSNRTKRPPVVAAPHPMERW